MKKLAVVIFLIGILSVACQKDDSEDMLLKDNSIGPISLEEAADLWKATAEQYGMTGEEPFTLTEVTTQELYDRMGIQVFVTSSGDSRLDRNAFYIDKEGYLSLFCSPFGQECRIVDNLKNIYTTDLDKDGNYEMVFQHEWFSVTEEYGFADYVRGTKIMWDPRKPGYKLSSAGSYAYLTSYPESEYSLEKIDDQTIYLRYKDADYDLRLTQYIPDLVNRGSFTIKRMDEHWPLDLKIRILKFENWWYNR